MKVLSIIHESIVPANADKGEYFYFRFVILTSQTHLKPTQ